MKVDQHIHNNHLSIIVKPNSQKAEIIGWDEDKKALRVNVHAKPEDNKANIEIVKLFSKSLKKKVVIKTGLRSREKILKIE
ncbi:TPA: YggU family protein [Candidatus Woesearchaeota archaeon]|nr:YggU family protein [Candidatus Woesearchaeota archaeon]HIH54707.1 YggU family protein [Candidatus Woesearchaeota archaeon]HIJ13992.1 YggU family protein [Candidatus Woesearchaeota archaeon]